MYKILEKLAEQLRKAGVEYTIEEHEGKKVIKFGDFIVQENGVALAGDYRKATQRIRMAINNM